MMIVPMPILLSQRKTSESIPHQMKDWLGSLPQDNVGAFYAKIRAPLVPVAKWFELPIWGQVCDGQARPDAVHRFLYNEFPLHGKGWTYLEWRTKLNNPQMCKYPTSGKVADPQPFSGEI